jgi:hypothetical protein
MRVARICDKRNAYKILFSKPEGYRASGKQWEVGE